MATPGLRIRRNPRQRGVALVMVLWALVIFAVITASLSRDTRSQLAVTRNLLDGARAEAAADGGVHRAIAALLAEGERESLRVDGTVYGWRVEDSLVRIRIQDEGGRIDINGADADLLAGLFEAVGVEPEAADVLADRVIDFRDPDSLLRPRGAEDDDYARAGLAHGAKDGFFDAVEELNLVLGMTPELYARVAGAVTVFTQRPVPDARFAPPLVRNVLAPAAGEESEAAPVAVAVGDLSVLASGPAPGQTQTNTIRIHAEARTAGGAVFAREAVVGLLPAQPGAARFQFLAWSQGERELFE